ncbi:ATP-dependent helicase, partial [Pseudomonas aeruginosa]
HLDQDDLKQIHWHAICLDEAQNIKNAQTKQARAIRRLSGKHKIALSGTPVENRLGELWSIFHFLNPGYLGSRAEFERRFAGPIEKEGDAR